MSIVFLLYILLLLLLRLVLVLVLVLLLLLLRLLLLLLLLLLLFLFLLLLQSALQPLVGFGLLYDFVPQSSIFTLLALSSFSLSSSLDRLLLGQAISVLVFLLVLMNMVPIQ